MKVENLWSFWVGEMSVHMACLKEQVLCSESSMSKIEFTSKANLLKIILDSLIKNLEESK